MTSPIIQWVSPTSPLRSGISKYAEDFFRAVDGAWSIRACLEDGSILKSMESVAPLADRNFDPEYPTIVHLGNSGFHEKAFRLAIAGGHVLVLHDIVLHHARAAAAVKLGRIGNYLKELDDEYGSEGVEAGRSLLAGCDVEIIERFPLCESYVRRAKVTVVHSEYAAASLERLAPEADVRVVPMGIPIPAVSPKREARRFLKLPPDALVVASITHVNPNKRIPIVLRAMRRLVARRPEAVLVLAGTGSDTREMDAEIRVLGLQPYVRQLGYVDDHKARLIASASDACVNLRYPTTGETSASLLRLFGAGRPVLISDAGTLAELPAGVGLKIPVDHLEVDTITDVLDAIGQYEGFAEDASVVAREFVRHNHTMAHMVSGYRDIIAEVYGVELPEMTEEIYEPDLDLGGPVRDVGSTNEIISQSVSAIHELGLTERSAVISDVAAAIAELRVDQSIRVPEIPSKRLVSRIGCPKCGGDIQSNLACKQCHFPMPFTGGVLLTLAG